MSEIDHPKYFFFIFHCWKENDPTQELEPGWRFSLLKSDSEERFGFTSLEAMVIFLKQSLEEKSSV
jgi:hypothetical protein